MVSNASDSKSVRTQPNRPSFSLITSVLLPYWISLPEPSTQSGFSFPFTVLLAPLARTLSRIYLPRALIFYHVIMSLFPTTSVSRRTLVRLPPTKMGAKAVSPEIRLQTRGSWMNRCRGRSFGTGATGPWTICQWTLPVWLFPSVFLSFFFSSLGSFFKCICICTDHRRIENVRCYGRDGRVAASWLADWFYCSTTTWSLVSLAVIVGSAAICCFE